MQTNYIWLRFTRFYVQSNVPGILLLDESLETLAMTNRARQREESRHDWKILKIVP